MKISYHEFSAESAKQVIDIFNYYVENTFAAFPEKPVPYEAFAMLKNMAAGFPSYTLIDEENNNICAGFGFLKPYNSMSSFKKTAAATYFIHPDYTGKGLGSLLLVKLELEAKKNGIRIILAEISSENTGSIGFHKKNGFNECGRLKSIGRKKEKDFDVVWMQKFITE